MERIPEGEGAHLQFENVRLGLDGVAEMDGARSLLFIPREEISRIELERGSGAERPIVSLVIGVALLALSFLPLLMLVNAFRGAGTFPMKAIATVAFIVPA